MNVKAAPDQKLPALHPGEDVGVTVTLPPALADRVSARQIGGALPCSSSSWVTSGELPVTSRRLRSSVTSGLEPTASCSAAESRASRLLLVACSDACRA